MSDEAPKRIELNSPVARFMFAHLDTARKVDPNNPNEEAKYQLTLCIDPEGQKTKQFKAMKQAVKKMIAAKWGDNPPKKLKNPFLTIEDLEKVPNGMEEGDVIVRLASTAKPEVVDQNVEEILDRSKIYSGCYGIVNMQCYAWSHPQGGKGVSFGLGPVQKVKDGEPLGGRAKPARDAFDALDEEDDDLDDDDDLI